MKKTVYFLLLCFTAYLVSCSEDDISKSKEEITSENYDHITSRKMALEDAPHYNKLKDLVSRISTGLNGTSSAKFGEADEFEILTDEILLMEYEDTHTYTFKIKRNHPLYYIENVVLHYDPQTEGYDEYLMQYDITAEQYLSIAGGEMLLEDVPVIVTQLENGTFAGVLDKGTGSICTRVCNIISVTCVGPNQYCQPGDTSCPYYGTENGAYTYQSCGIVCVKVQNPEMDPGDSGGGSGGGGSGNHTYTNPLPMEPCDAGVGGTGIDNGNGMCVVPWVAALGLNDEHLGYLARNPNVTAMISTYFLAHSMNPETKGFIMTVFSFLMEFENEIVSPENILYRIEALEQYLYDHPYAISNIPCDQIPQWQEVAQHQVPQSVKNKLQNLDNAQTSPYYGWALQNIENADGANVNNDYFSVTFNTMPYKPFPHQNEQFTPEEFLYYVRTNLDSFVNTNYSSFTPSHQTGYNEGAIWYSNNPVEAIIHINIPNPINNQYGDDGSVITSGYQINTNGFGGFSNGHWIFTTIKTPYASLTQGLDGEHPVSGHRKFGLIKSGDSYTIYTRGVDRVTGGLGATLVGQNYMFTQADNLWTSFQQGIKGYIQNNSYGNTVTINPPEKWRPKWQEVKDVLINNYPPSTLDECN